MKAALALALVVMVGGGGWLAASLTDHADQAVPAATTPSTSSSWPAPPRPRAATGDGQGMVVPAAAGAPKTSGPRIDVYLDPQCPWCKRFHETLKAGLDDLRSRGAATVVVHPKSFLDARLGNDSSQRAAEAMACASDAGRLWEYTDAMFAGQPTAEGQGFTDAELDAFAARAGITGAASTQYRACTSTHRYSAYVAAVEQVSARDDRVMATPTYRVDGHDVDLSGVLPENAPPNPQAFFDQVRAP